MKLTCSLTLSSWCEAPSNIALDLTQGDDEYKRRRKNDSHYWDFRMLPKGGTDRVVFFGSKDCLESFCYYNAGEAPKVRE